MKYKLDELFDLQMGKTPPRNNSEYWNTRDNKWVSIGDLTKCGKYISETKEYISNTAVEDSGISIVPKNTVIMSFKLSIGKTAITKEPIYTNEAIMAFRDKKVARIVPEYLYYLFSGKDWDEGSNKAVMGKTLNKATLSGITIDIHDYDSQVEIVRILDKTQGIIDNYKLELIKLDELIKARFVEMFGDININNKGWEVYPLGKLCTIVRGGSPRPIDQFLGGTVPWIKIGDATEGDNIFLNSTKEYIIPEGVKKSRLVNGLVTAYCYKNVTFREMGYLTKRCSAAAGVWPGGWPGPHFFESEVHIVEMRSTK